jgi:hypothetical protein
VNPTKELLLEMIDLAFHRRSWHGANLMAAVRGVRASVAARSFKGRKSIWEQVLHCAYWKHAAVNKLIGTASFPRRGRNWPKLPDARNEQAWRADLELLREQHGALRQAIVDFPLPRLTGRRIWLIHGIAAHDVYHTGQIKLLRRLISRRK